MNSNRYVKQWRFNKILFKLFQYWDTSGTCQCFKSAILYGHFDWVSMEKLALDCIFSRLGPGQPSAAPSTMGLNVRRNLIFKFVIVTLQQTRDWIDARTSGGNFHLSCFWMRENQTKLFLLRAANFSTENSLKAFRSFSSPKFVWASKLNSFFIVFTSF